jgi:hypothetical protein
MFSFEDWRRLVWWRRKVGSGADNLKFLRELKLWELTGNRKFGFPASKVKVPEELSAKPYAKRHFLGGAWPR